MTWKHNPRGLRWRLVLWLTGGYIEAVPLRGFTSATAIIRVKLGRPGYSNTADLIEKA